VKRILPVEPLSHAAFSPFGSVISADRDDIASRPANQGTAARQDFLAEVVDLRPGRAKLNLAAFRCAPRPGSRVELHLLEKHPASTQVFVPMNARRYLVVVALGGDRPDLSTSRAFLAGPTQGIGYAPGAWHHPMIALDEPTDFACLVWEDGSEGDCVVFPFPEGEGLGIDLP
jgi:ureidoglycolate lyase